MMLLLITLLLMAPLFKLMHRSESCLCFSKDAHNFNPKQQFFIANSCQQFLVLFVISYSVMGMLKFLDLGWNHWLDPFGYLDGIQCLACFISLFRKAWIYYLV